MRNQVQSIEEYIQRIPEGKRSHFIKLRETIRENLPQGFQEILIYGMIGYVVPLEIYPAVYHAKQGIPLPFVNIAAQKNFFALYHMGIYADPDLLDWFVREYPRHSQQKLDMGKSCIRFKKMDQIPYQLIGELMRKMTVRDWIALFEKNLKR